MVITYQVDTVTIYPAIYPVNRLLKEFGMERTGYLASLPPHYL